jgi:hypothetical protein
MTFTPTGLGEWHSRGDGYPVRVLLLASNLSALSHGVFPLRLLQTEGIPRRRDKHCLRPSISCIHHWIRRCGSDRALAFPVLAIVPMMHPSISRCVTYYGHRWEMRVHYCAGYRIQKQRHSSAVTVPACCMGNHHVPCCRLILEPTYIRLENHPTCARSPLYRPVNPT